MSKTEELLHKWKVLPEFLNIDLCGVWEISPPVQKKYRPDFLPKVPK